MCSIVSEASWQHSHPVTSAGVCRSDAGRGRMELAEGVAVQARRRIAVVEVVADAALLGRDRHVARQAAAESTATAGALFAPSLLEVSTAESS